MIRMILAKISDPVYGVYIAKFRKFKAYSPETAVTKEQLFPKGRNEVDSDRMKKLLKIGVVKSSKPNEYWLDRKEMYKPDEYTKRRLRELIFAIITAIVMYHVLKFFGIYY